MEQRFRFGRLWSAAVASNLGDGLVLAAFPLLAARVTREPLAVSAITVAIGLPWLVMGPIAGAVVDRVDRRQLMVLIDSLRVLILVVFSLVVVSGLESLWMLYGVVFLIASGETLVDTSSQSILPALVSKEELDRANGLLFSTMTVANRFIGPPLGGLLFGVAAYAPFAVDAASFLIAALLTFTLAGSFKPKSDQSRDIDTIYDSVIEGMRWLWRNKPIRAFAVGAAVLNVGLMAGEAILVLFAGQQLGLSAVGFGALFAATASGYAAGSFVAPALTSRFDRFAIIIGVVATISLSLLAVGLAGHWLLAAFGLLVIGVASGLWDVIAVSYRQAAVPDRLLGRIMAAYRVIAHGSVPLGGIIGGVSAQMAGNRAAFFVGAGIVVLILPYLSTTLRSVDLDPAQITA